MKRLYIIFRQDFFYNLRRPLFWILVLILVFTAYGLSTGTVQIQSGDSRVGGTKAWITSQFAVAQMLTLVVFLFYSFFITVAAGMAIINDDELKIGEIIHATPLRAGEYVWGKFLAVLLSFLVVMAFHLLAMMFFNHLVANAKASEIRGPFALIYYLRPALVFTVPTIVFLAGTAFAIGEWARRPIVLFVLPVALILVCGFFLWEWSPSWLDSRINRVLMLLDPSGFRWLNETWLKGGDRGVEFYNKADIPFDIPFLISRLIFIGIGLLSVVLCQRHLAANLRGALGTRQANRLRGQHARKLERPEVETNPIETMATPSLAGLNMSSRPIGFFQSLFLVCRTELKELRTQPGIYLFVPLILIQTIGANFAGVGPFDTPLLLTSGIVAMASLNTLSVFLCLLLMFYTVESLQRERTTGLASIHYATPVKTFALLAGKALANSILGVAVVLAALVGGIIVLLVQGQVAITLWPFALVWGLLLIPTFLVWTTFVAAVYSITANRYAAYAISLWVLIFTGYRTLTNQINWVGNWCLWISPRWSDMSVFELDRTALILNRVMVLGLSLFFTIIAVRTFRRGDFDPTRVLTRFYPLALLKTGLRLLPYAAVSLVAGTFLWAQVYQGFQGHLAKKREKDYWRANLATWKDVPLPALTAVDIDLELEPAKRWFRVNGSYDLMNHRAQAIPKIPITAGFWENVSWTLNGLEYQPENRSNLFIFTPPNHLAPGAKVRVGFSYEGTVPSGVSENGRGTMEFILPAGVVLTSFSASFVPLLGYQENIGIDKDNKYDSRNYPDNFYEGITEPGFGSGTSFTTKIRITAPEEYTMNSVGTITDQKTENGRRTVVWQSDHPVRFFNVVGGRWIKRRGLNTVVYYDPRHAYNIDEISEALDASRRYYSEWFYPYPWKELKLSEFANLATYAQGFPTNITFSEGIGFLTRSEPMSDVAFMVTAHEAAHQWWGNILTPGKGPGGNILAEGMAHFSTILLFDQVKGLQPRIEFCKKIEDTYNKSRQVDSEQPLVKTDDSRPGDTTVTYDKGGWVFWMLLKHMGRDRTLRGLRAFIDQYHNGPDFPVLQDFVAVMRRFAPDAAAYDAFVKQWFFEVVVPEYQLSEAGREQAFSGQAESWQVTVRVRNIGTATMPVDVAATANDRFTKDGQPNPDYHESRTKITLGAGEDKEVTLRCPFKPEQVVVDPDALVLQLRRKAALIRF